MTERYFPFDSGAGGNVSEDQWQMMAQHWLRRGIMRVAGPRLEVSANGTTRSVTVRPGQASIDGYFYESDADVVVSINAAHATLSRLDYVVLRLDRAANTILVTSLGGTPAADPVVPALTDTPSVIDLPLASVRVHPATAPVNNNPNIINAGDVADHRPMVGTTNFLARTAATTSQLAVDVTDVVSLGLWLPPQRRIRLSGTLSFASTVVADAYAIRFREAGVNIGKVDIDTVNLTSVRTRHGECQVFPAAGFHTFSLSLERVGGTGTLTALAHGPTSPTELYAEDLGTA